MKMKLPVLLPLVWGGTALTCLSQTENPRPLPPLEPGQRVLASSIEILPSGQRMTVQRVTPPQSAYKPAPPPPITPAVSPQVREARRAQWAARAPMETRLLPVTATVYPGGITHLAWRHETAAGAWQDFEAWSRTDFSSLHVVSDFEISRVRYLVFASVVDGSLRMAGQRRLPDGAALPPAGQFLLVKGGAGELEALAPIEALHEEYERRGPVLDAAWAAQMEAGRQEQARREAAEKEDVVVRFWKTPPRKSAPLQRKGGAQ